MPIFNQVPEFKARISFFLTESGGRKSPAKSILRQSANFGDEGLVSCELFFLDKKKVKPGEEVTCDVCMLFINDRLKKTIQPGKKFNLQEGNHKKAEGIVLEVYEENMVINA